MSEERIGRYRVVARIAEAPLERVSGSRLLAEAERQGDAAPRRLYVVTVRDTDTRELLADSLLTCVQLKHGNVVAMLDAGVFGERVYAAMTLDGALPLAELATAIQSVRPRERALIVAAIGADVAIGLQAGHDLASRGLVHDALDLQSIFIDKNGRARIDAVFLDPWIASETIAKSAAPFVAPERWKAPAGLGTDVFALGCILDHLLAPVPGGAVIDVITAAHATVPERRPRSAHEVAERLTKSFDIDAGRRALAAITLAADAPVSVTRVGLGSREAASQKTRPSVPRPAPRPTPAAAVEAPPRTSRMGSLEVAEAEAEVESDATVVEMSPLERPHLDRRDENTPIAMDIPKVANAMRGNLQRNDDEDEDDEEVDGRTVVAPLWTAAMAKADATRDDAAPSSIRQSSSARGWEIKTGSRALGRAAPAKDTPKDIPLGRIPSTPSFPMEPARDKRAKPIPISQVPVLWSEDSSSDSDVRTRARAGPALVDLAPARVENAPPATPPLPAQESATADLEIDASFPRGPRTNAVRLALAIVLLLSIVVVVAVFLTRR